MENLWSRCETSNNKTDNIINIMNEQIEYLQELTNKKVRGKYGIIEYLENIKNIGKLLNQMNLQKIPFGTINEDDSDREYLNDDYNDLEDANTLYDNHRYAFEIYNHTYKYRLFEVLLSPVYPICLNVEEGILDDETKSKLHGITKFLEKENNVIIESEDKYVQCLKIIFNSRKVRYIIEKLCKD